MNDSPYGLTASVWTNAEANPESHEAFLHMVDELQTGTVFLNRCAPQFSYVWCSDGRWLIAVDVDVVCRCDYLDPALAWTGVKNSGRGVSLSKFGIRFRASLDFDSGEFAM